MSPKNLHTVIENLHVGLSEAPNQTMRGNTNIMHDSSYIPLMLILPVFGI